MSVEEAKKMNAYKSKSNSLDRDILEQYMKVRYSDYRRKNTREMLVGEL